MVNNTTQVGRITRDLEVKATPKGGNVLNFSIAVQRNFKDQNGEYGVDFFNCVAFNHTANHIGKYAKKGNIISIVGKLQSRKYEKEDGTTQNIVEIVVNECDVFTGNQKVETSNELSPQDFMGVPVNKVDDIGDDLPF